MAGNLLVLLFQGEETAGTVWTNMESLQAAGVVDVEDAVVAWRAAPGEVAVTAETKKGSDSSLVPIVSVNATDIVHVEQKTPTHKGKYAKAGAGIGFIAGLLLGGPIGGLAVGAGIGALAGKMKDHGIDDKFIKETTTALQPGSSAIFVLGTASNPDVLVAELRAFQPRVLSTTLSEEKEKELRIKLS